MKRNASIKPYGFIAGFGLVSMFMDIVYEGALAVQGPLLLSLGASAALVGIVSGLGEATSLAGRLASGPAADRTGRYWLFAIIGYAITAIAVPSMGFVGSVAGVSALIIIERLGKSVRTPSRDAMLSSASSAVGRGKGFALHEALDQVGAVCGPLIVAGILWATSNDYAPALGILAVPGAIAIVILLRLRAQAPDPSVFEEEAKAERDRADAPDAAASATTAAAPAEAAPAAAQPAAATQPAPAQPTPAQPAGSPRLPRVFWLYAATCGLCLTGVATFAVLSFHAVSVGVLGAAAVPVVYAVAMGVDAVSALVTGNLYDRVGPKTLLALPVLCALIPLFAYGTSLVGVVAGAVIWGLAIGVQESTMRACVADLVPGNARATSYGIFSVFTGIGTLLGGTIAGSLYASAGTGAIIAWTLIVQAVVFALLVFIFRKKSAA